MSTSAFPKAGSTPSKTPFSAKKTSTKKNTSILSFFQKTDGPPKATSTQQRITQFGSKIPRNGKSAKNGTRVGTGAGNNLGVWGQDSAGGKDAGGLFFDDKRGSGTRTEENKDNDGVEFARGRSRTPDDDLWGEREDEKFNENHAAVKRRRIQEASSLEEESKEDATAKEMTPISIKAKKNNGPFIDESDSEDDLEAFREVVDVPAESKSKPKPDGELDLDVAAGDISPTKEESPNTPPLAAERPPLVREATSHIENDEFADFDDLEEDEFRGEDFLEGQWTEEQKDLELGGYETPETSGAGETNEDMNNEIPSCPICQASLGGLSHSEVSVHVNNCLDGNPSLVPTAKKTVTTTASMSRAERASIARPAQSDPHAIHASAATSAFSKLMAGNAEDSAWAAAAAHEVASRGKQAYERTCPFYKIITGYSICVDAFRYGAVQGCNAYFLSHFHSDHYVGLTSSWRHGPIYCSRVTANLVRQQLKVDPKWVVDLEFETTTEVPGTEGVRVTMIPANHCPGSSLFLFEKTIGSGPSSRLHRVLHCGDFRACPAHVQHPMLRPEAIDVVTGKTRQQRIDVCYLDTTYLNPKYSFPPQDDVVKACAEICVSLDQNDGDAAMFAKSSNGHAAGGLTKFLSNGNASGDTNQSSSAGRGRLLVVVGTYSIGKERLCVAIARALKCKIWANPAKQRVCSCLEDPELSALLTDDPLEAQVHMQTIFEIRAETLQEYLASMKPHFSKVVGFRPTGWNYRPPAGRMLDNPPVSAVLHSDNWKTRFSVRNLVPQRGSTKESSCFGVPYSEHSSFRELTMFCCSLRIARIIPTVNVGNRKTREKMKAWFERWEVEKRKTGLFRVEGQDW